MTIKLPPEWEQFVAERVDNGAYPSPGDVIRDGLLLLREREEERRILEELRREVAIGIAEDEAGKVAPFDPQQTLDRVLAKRDT